MRPSRPAQVRDGDGLAARRIAPAVHRVNAAKTNAAINVAMAQRVYNYLFARELKPSE
jgi:hypothetical protein